MTPSRCGIAVMNRYMKPHFVSLFLNPFTSTCLQELQPCPPATGSVRLPNGNSTPILSSGSATISPSHTLHKVLYVPDFRFNLLSMSKFTAQHNCCVVFHPHFCLFKDLLTGKVTGIGKQKHGFYYFFQPKSYVVATEYLPLNVSQLNIVSSISLLVMLHLVKK